MYCDRILTAFGEVEKSWFRQKYFISFKKASKYLATHLQPKNLKF